MRSKSVLIAIALVIAACGDSDPSDAGTGDDAATEGVHLAETEVGPALVGPDGMTLYVFANDLPGESVCVDDCAELWPPVPGDTAVGSDLDASIFGTITRPDGSDQLTVNEMPLYWYQPDEQPGDAKGQGVGGVWFVVDASGDVIEASASTPTVIDYDYGAGG